MRVPKALLYDHSLSSETKHTYLALCWVQQAERRTIRDDLYVPVRSLGSLLRVSRNTARKRLRELKEEHLIEDSPAPPRDGVQPIRMAPLEIRYDVESSGD